MHMIEIVFVGVLLLGLIGILYLRIRLGAVAKYRFNLRKELLKLDTTLHQQGRFEEMIELKQWFTTTVDFDTMIKKWWEWPLKKFYDFTYVNKLQDSINEERTAIFRK